MYDIDSVGFICQPQRNHWRSLLVARKTILSEASSFLQEPRLYLLLLHRIYDVLSVARLKHGLHGNISVCSFCFLPCARICTIFVVTRGSRNILISFFFEVVCED